LAHKDPQVQPVPLVRPALLVQLVLLALLAHKDP
jgi:hypothetical protein